MEEDVREAREILRLIFKHKRTQLTADEQQMLDDFVNGSPDNAELVQLLATSEGYDKLLTEEVEAEKVWQGTKFHFPHDRHKRRKPAISILQLILITITVLLLVGVAAWFLVWMSGRG